MNQATNLPPPAKTDVRDFAYDASDLGEHENVAQIREERDVEVGEAHNTPAKPALPQSPVTHNKHSIPINPKSLINMIFSLCGIDKLGKYQQHRRNALQLVSSQDAILTLGDAVDKLRHDEFHQMDNKVRERIEKFRRLIGVSEKQEELKNDIILIKYATDMSFARNSTPEEMWEAIQRREAWKQGPWVMTGVSIAQVVICAIVLMTQNSPINESTLIMACIYLVAYATSIPFEVTKDLQDLLMQVHRKRLQHSLALEVICLILSPLLVIPFFVTITIDLVIGKIKNVCYGEMINCITEFIVVFTGFSVGLRSGNPVNAVQTFAGFSFIAEMDELLMRKFEVDMDSYVYIKEGAWLKKKKLTVRLTIYIVVPILFALFIYITLYNTCFLFCVVS